jgi:hypothetical protein
MKTLIALAFLMMLALSLSTAGAEIKANSKNPDPSFPRITLNKGEKFENDDIIVHFSGYKILGSPALQKAYADRNFHPSRLYNMELSFEITNKNGKKAKSTLMDIYINESKFKEKPYNYANVDPKVHYVFTITFSKKDNVELDPTTIRTVMQHYIIYDAGKGKNNYTENPFSEGYLIFNTPQ